MRHINVHSAVTSTCITKYSQSYMCEPQGELGGPLADPVDRVAVDSDGSEAEDSSSYLSSSSQDHDEVSSEEDELEAIPLPSDLQDSRHP